MYNYDEKLDLKTYYKKRFLGIYPVFWIAYSILFLYTFWKNKGFFVSEPIYKLILSVLGMDGYLATYTGTFYLIGDWFLGCIVLVYMLFPILQFAVRKIPKLLFCIATALYLLVIFKSNFKIPLNQNLIISLYSFLLGMYFIRYIKNVKWWQVLLITAVGMLFFKKGISSKMIRALFFENLAAYCFLFPFCYLGGKIKGNFIKNVIGKISKYSYIIFLLQHYVILQLSQYFSGSIESKYGMLCTYLICWGIIFALGKLIYILNQKILELFKKQEV